MHAYINTHIHVYRRTCPVCTRTRRHAQSNVTRGHNMDRSVTRRKPQRPGIASNDTTTHVPTARSSADLTKPNHTPTMDRSVRCSAGCVHADRDYRSPGGSESGVMIKAALNRNGIGRAVTASGARPPPACCMGWLVPWARMEQVRFHRVEAGCVLENSGAVAGVGVTVGDVDV